MATWVLKRQLPLKDLLGEREQPWEISLLRGLANIRLFSKQAAQCRFQQACLQGQNSKYLETEAFFFFKYADTRLSPQSTVSKD